MLPSASRAPELKLNVVKILAFDLSYGLMNLFILAVCCLCYQYCYFIDVFHYAEHHFNAWFSVVKFWLKV